jgi:glycerol-1-phosphate dehydrogenase [NAD(P)+]
MMTMITPLVHIGADALEALSAYVAQRGLTRFDLLADVNTWEALGQRAAAQLAGAGGAVRPIILPGDVVADEEAIVQVLLQANEPERTLVAVGSGTLTDIGRFVSHRGRRRFISLPTAPSVDAYSSINSPLVIRRLKETINAHAPEAIFADLGVLCAAPPAMIAAGYGDILAKYTCLADWRLGQLLWGEDLDEAVVQEMQRALAQVAPQAEAIGRGEPEAIAALMTALIASGNAMAAVGSSRPASGAEHHISHYLEMRLLQAGRPPVLHGAKVGAATVLMARAYQRLAGLDSSKVARLLAADPWPSAAAQQEEIRAGYGEIAAQVVASHRGFALDSAARRAFYERILAQWPRVLAVAAAVPNPARLASWLHQAGGPSELTALGFDPQEVAQAVRFAHYVRARFTVRQIELALGLEALHSPGLRLE